MDRDALTTFLTTEYDSLLDEAGIAPTDTADGLAPVLDHVAAVLAGHDDLTVVWHRLLASYYALDRVVNRFAVNMAVSISGDSYNLKHQFDHAKKLRDEMFARVAWLVEPVPEDGGGGMPGDMFAIEIPYLGGGDERWP